MAEHPILFSGAMVRAILDGTKTQTRRVVKWRPVSPADVSATRPPDEAQPYTHIPGAWLATWERDDGWQSSMPTVCPFGVPGDRLWVRETWQEVHPLQVTDGRYSQRGRAGIPGPPPVAYRTIYRADGHYPPIHTPEGVPRYPWRVLCAGKSCQRTHITGWRPSVHMPRAASRLTLEITDVRVERLTSITEEDALAEGCKPFTFREIWSAYSKSCDGYVEAFSPEKLQGPDYEGLRHHPAKQLESARQDFHKLWDSINGKRPGCAWHDDPWVWVVSFRRVEVPGE